MKLIALWLAMAAAPLFAAPAATVWTLADPRSVGGTATQLLGSPAAGPDGAVAFNGVDQGIVVPVNPLAGLSRFTVAVLFRPVEPAPFAQRFLHVEDEAGRRLTVEDRVVPGKGWYLDTFLLDGPNHRTLIDPARLHPIGRWTWAALVYDGSTMTSYVDGVPELSGPIAFRPMGPGRASVGVRLNRVFWFKGEIREVRFYPEALEAGRLPRPFGVSSVLPSR